jgi:3-hydroxyisobutyrate dehydrogenase-like beta-hydroxyacid dehydrogenase
MTVRIGFIGTGFIARTHSWFLKHTAADRAIVAVHDLDADRAREFAGRVGAEDVMEPDELLDRVDVVFVTTWTSEHERLVTAAAERGVAVFCEKPLAFDATSAGPADDRVGRDGRGREPGRADPAIHAAVRACEDPARRRTLRSPAGRLVP